MQHVRAAQNGTQRRDRRALRRWRRGRSARAGVLYASSTGIPSEDRPAGAHGPGAYDATPGKA